MHMTQDIEFAATAIESAPEMDSVTESVLLLLAVGETPSDQWSLLSATSTMLGRPVQVSELDDLFGCGLLTRHGGQVAARGDLPTRRALDLAPPARVVT